jgi:glucosamine-6-phosphate deaminase
MNYGKTTVVICKDNAALGQRAAADVARTMRDLLKKQKEVRMVFAAGESQTTFLDALARERDIEWPRVACFNMDEMYDVRMPAEFTCSHQTTTQLFNKVKPARVHLLAHNAASAEEEARRFEALLRQEGPPDILCQGIGTSGHLAFNEPGDADFADQRWVRVIRVAAQSQKQLMTDPNFKKLGYIPTQGITMTIPALFSAKYKFTMVPLALKRPILEKLFALKKPTTDLPASILLTAEGTLYLDQDSCQAKFL